MNNPFSRRTAILILAGLALAVITGLARAEVVDRIVAQVNDEIITLSEVEAMARTMDPEGGVGPKTQMKQLQREMLEALIDRKLAIPEAKRRGINVSDKEVDRALQEFKQRNNLPDDAALDKVLTQAGLTYKDLRGQIQGQIYQERLAGVIVGGKATVSDAEVRRYYDEHAKESAGVQTHMRMVTLEFPANATTAQKEEIQKKAEAILAEMRPAGAGSLVDVARKHGVNGMDLGFMAETDMAPPVAEALSRAKPGVILPIQTPVGFQLIQLVERRAGKPTSFEEAAPRIRQILVRRDMDKLFSEWVKTLRSNAVIKIML